MLSQCSSFWIFLSNEFFWNRNSARRVWLVTEIIKTVPSLIRRGLQRPASFPKIVSQFSTRLRSGLGCSSLYLSLSSTINEWIEAGALLKGWFWLLGRPKKSEIKFSLYLKNGILIGHKADLCPWTDRAKWVHSYYKYIINTVFLIIFCKTL